MYYAIYHPYGTRTISGGDELIRFGTKAERDAYVDADRWDGSNYHREAVTRAHARRRFPGAFRDLDVVPTFRRVAADGSLLEEPHYYRGEPHWDLYHDGSQQYQR